MGFAIITGICGGWPSFAGAENHIYSTTIQGMLGLNTVPSARMDEAGTIRLGIATLDPYAHSYLGFQIADPLYISLRQSAEISGLNDNADRLYPGVDIKLRLMKENGSRPEIAIGLQSAIGHKRMASEYVTLSKRYKNFDFTAGMGWGRLGSAGNIDNPLRALPGDFGENRAPDGEMPNEPNDWLTGKDVGIFGGVEYFTPLRGLSVKLDWTGDRYEAEQAALDFQAPAPWSAGISYQPADWIDISLAAQGTDKIMGRLSLQGLMSQWKSQHRKNKNEQPLRSYRTHITTPANMILDAAKENVFIDDAQADLYRAHTQMMLNNYSSAPYQLGRAAINMANHAGPTIEELLIVPSVMGLQGPSVRLMRRDFEQALTHHQSSPEEIWQNAEFDTVERKAFKKLERSSEHGNFLTGMRLISDTQISLAEEDSGVLYRTALLAKFRAPDFLGFLDSGLSIRWNIADNLQHLQDMRLPSVLPVRSNVDVFAERGLAIDESYLAFTHSFKTNLHFSLISGYLEEMYAGTGGEILFRPFKSRLALGVESWLALKRDPYAPLNLGLNGDHLLTGHVNAWYDMPNMDLTLKARAGRYLAEDVGFTLGLGKNFDNGARLEGFTTVTDQGDFDAFGGITHAYNGVRLTLPLGGFKYMPAGSSIKLRAEPFGRDAGQALENPLPLYELTEPFSYRHMAQHWAEILP